MRRFAKYFLVMLLPLTVLLVRPLTPAAVLMFGQEIRLATVPVDPRDIFRGDYVTLSFAIEQPSGDLISPEERDSVYDRLSYYSPIDFNSPEFFLYVTLEPDNAGICQPVKISAARPETGIYLRARAVRTHIGDGVGLDYGDYLNRYYVKENTGLELEDLARRGELAAIVKVWRGRAVITSVEEMRKERNE